MGKKESERPKNVASEAEPLGTSQSKNDSMSDIPDFTPEERAWLKEESSRFEKDYVPTRSLIPGF